MKNYPHFLTKCIGQELRYIFANAIDVNLKEQQAVCSGRVTDGINDNHHTANIKLAFGNRLMDGFLLSSSYEVNDKGEYKNTLQFHPLEEFNEIFSKNIIAPKEVLKAIKIIQLSHAKSLLLLFESGSTLQITPHERDQMESILLVDFHDRSESLSFHEDQILEEYYTHMI